MILSLGASGFLVTDFDFECADGCLSVDLSFLALRLQEGLLRLNCSYLKLCLEMVLRFFSIKTLSPGRQKLKLSNSSGVILLFLSILRVLIRNYFPTVDIFLLVRTD